MLVWVTAVWQTGCLLSEHGNTGLPATGHSICYEYGTFRQELQDGWQTEFPDNWLRAALYGSTRSRMKPLKYTLKAKFRNTGRIPITTSLTTTTTPYWQFRMTCMFLVTAVKAFLLCVCGRQKLRALI